MPEKNKHYTQVEKAKRGWWASVVFMLLIVVLIVFLSYVKIVEENRDILIESSVCSLQVFLPCLQLRPGRDPSELEEVKDKLSGKECRSLTYREIKRCTNTNATLKGTNL